MPFRHQPGDLALLELEGGRLVEVVIEDVPIEREPLMACAAPCDDQPHCILWPSVIATELDEEGRRPRAYLVADHELRPRTLALPKETT
ncbi:hypothetical protein D3C72_780870 [compost metagenome]